MELGTLKQTVYFRKAQRTGAVDDATLARHARDVIFGRNLSAQAPVEVANTVAGLLIAESHPERTSVSSPLVFRATLMLLDLIEHNIPMDATPSTIPGARC